MLLDRIRKPQDIKTIPEYRLDELAEEIRRSILEVVSKRGGHLAANLGVVELTIALHRVYDLPTDKLIWDVGHQCYTHKILSGRKDEFPRLRQSDGISGFPRREESDCDSFDTGHSSTSISAGLGYVRARELTGADYSVVSVIGDGAFTGGMTFEALNDAARIHTNFVVVLNDNEMSISKNVGGFSDYLARIRTSSKYTNLKLDISSAFEKIPVYGEKLIDAVRRTKSSIKQLVIPGMFFEDMGLTYLGPVDGHNISQMIRVFRVAKNFQGPVVVHVITKKGRGYAPAARNPSRFHGISSFEIKTGEPLEKSGTSFTDIFSDKIVEMAEKDERIVAVTAAMKEGVGLSAFAKRFPQRFFDVGIAEEHAVTFSAGLALGGLLPVFAVYSSFLQRGFDQLMTDVCQQNLHVVFAVDRAGFVGPDGKSHQGCFDLSYLSVLPGMTVMAPKDGEELKRMLDFAAGFDGPVAIRYPRGEAESMVTMGSTGSADTLYLRGKEDASLTGREAAADARHAHGETADETRMTSQPTAADARHTREDTEANTAGGLEHEAADVHCVRGETDAEIPDDLEHEAADAPIVYGKSELLHQGSRVAVLAVGAMVPEALQLIGILSRQGISPSVYNARFVKPVDEELIRSLPVNHELIVTMEENVLSGGYGEAVLREVNRKSLPIDVLNLAVNDEYVRHGSIQEQRKKCGLDAASAARRILRRLSESEAD